MLCPVYSGPLNDSCAAIKALRTRVRRLTAPEISGMAPGMAFSRPSRSGTGLGYIAICKNKLFLGPKPIDPMAMHFACLFRKYFKTILFIRGFA